MSTPPLVAAPAAASIIFSNNSPPASTAVSLFAALLRATTGCSVGNKSSAAPGKIRVPQGLRKPRPKRLPPRRRRPNSPTSSHPHRQHRTGKALTRTTKTGVELLLAAVNGGGRGWMSEAREVSGLSGEAGRDPAPMVPGNSGSVPSVPRFHIAACSRRLLRRRISAGLAYPFSRISQGSHFRTGCLS